jgi:secreted PhoX family phosphatase
MRTSYDSTGTRVRGMVNNCGQGKTPWGTVLTCEENFHSYFGNLSGLPESDPRRAVHQRYGVSTAASERRWELHHDRFDVVKEPNESFRFGWVVEIDPYDPDFTPRKRTALGRLKHEAATTKVSKEGHVVVYTGDDERYEYAYKFVSSGHFDPSDRAANLDLLDDGTLYVARFNDDGSGVWLPLVYGQGPLTSANRFSSQADVLLNTRRAADLLGATKMDRPEDFEPNPANGKIYLVMTFNERRTDAEVDAANPRAENLHGHIIEIAEASDDAAATTFTWEMFLVCGNPSTDGTVYCAGFDPSMISPISAPDNIAFDQSGNLWIATDGQIRSASFRMNDAVFVVPTEGPERGYLRQFLSGVSGGEVASLAFASNDETLFVCIQHPGEGGKFDDATSRFPDGTLPPRPAVVAVTRTALGSGTIGA